MRGEIISNIFHFPIDKIIGEKFDNARVETSLAILVSKFHILLLIDLYSLLIQSVIN